MPVLAFSDELVRDASLLGRLDAAVVTEFCSMAVAALHEGMPQASVFNKAASRLNVKAEEVSSAVKALGQILLECSKRLLTEKDFRLSVLDCAFPEPIVDLVAAAYVANVRELRKFLSDMSLKLPHYDNLEWRLDVEVSSRSLRRQVQPMFLLNLQTRSVDEQPSSRVLQSSFANLSHVCDELEKAVKQVKTPHARRVIRYIN